MFLNIQPGQLDYITEGLIRVLLIIAGFQLVKKVPDVINIIFGTHIKDGGGIKGRLGEMAAVGGLAQKAWSSLGAGAKKIGGNLVKLGLQAPIAGAFVAANAAYHKKTGGKWLKDDPAFQQGKGILYGVRGAFKSGSLFTGYQEYEKGSEPPQHSNKEKAKARDHTLNALHVGGAGTTPQGTYDPVKRGADGAPMRDASGKPVFKKLTKLYDSDGDNGIFEEMANTRTQYHASFDRTDIGRRMSTSLDGGTLAHKKYVDILSVKESTDKVEPYIDIVYGRIHADDSPYTKEEQEISANIQEKFKNKEKIITADEADFLKRYLMPEEASDFRTVVEKQNRTMGTTLGQHKDIRDVDLYASGVLGHTLSSAQKVDNDFDTQQTTLKAQMSDIEQLDYEIFKNTLNQQADAIKGANPFNDRAPTYLIKYKTKDSSGKEVEIVDPLKWASDSKWLTDGKVGSGIKTRPNQNNQQGSENE